MMTVEVKRRAVFRKRASRAVAQSAGDIDIENIAPTSGQFAEEPRKICLGLGVGNDVERLAVRRTENVRPIVTSRGRPVDQNRGADNGYLAMVCGQPRDGRGDLLFKARTAL